MISVVKVLFVTYEYSTLILLLSVRVMRKGCSKSVGSSYMNDRITLIFWRFLFQTIKVSQSNRKSST
jgi:hypothetical protein